MNTVYVPPEFACLFILPIITFCLMIRQYYFSLTTCVATYIILQSFLAGLARHIYS